MVVSERPPRFYALQWIDSISDSIFSFHATEINDLREDKIR